MTRHEGQSFILRSSLLMLATSQCLPAAHYSSLSPPAGSCPMNRPYSSRRSRRSPRSTSACPWRTRSCCGSCTTATCWEVPAASPPPHLSTRHGTRPPSPPPRPCRPDNPAPDSNNPCFSFDLLMLLITFSSLTKMKATPNTERPESQQCCWILLKNI